MRSSEEGEEEEKAVTVVVVVSFGGHVGQATAAADVATEAAARLSSNEDDVSMARGQPTLSELIVWRVVAFRRRVLRRPNEIHQTNR